MRVTDDLDRGPGTCMTLTISLFGLVLWVAMSTVSAARPLRYTLPTFRETPNNITAVVGSDVILPCSVDNLGPKSIIWKKVNKASPITIGEYVFDPDNRYSVTREDPYMDSQMASIDSQRSGYENPRWNLQISNVDFEHAGTYECQISTKEDFARNVTLNIIKDRNRDAAKKTGIKLSGTQFVEKGTSIDLNCTATDIDYRPKGVDWFKDGTRVKPGGRTLVTEYLVSETNVLHSRLEIERVGMEDAGTYVCRFSQHHVESMKVIVLNTDSFNKRRGTGTNRLDSTVADKRKTPNSTAKGEAINSLSPGRVQVPLTPEQGTGADGVESAVADNHKAHSSTATRESINCLSLAMTLTFIYALLT